MPTTTPEWAIYKFADNLPLAVWDGHPAHCCALIQMVEPFAVTDESKPDAESAFAYEVAKDLIMSASGNRPIRWAKDMMLCAEGVFIPPGMPLHGPAAVGVDGLVIEIAGPRFQIFGNDSKKWLKHSHLPKQKKKRTMFLEYLFRS